MHRVHPLKALSAVDLVAIKHRALAAILPERPHIFIPRLLDPRPPGRLQRRPPAGGEHLVQIGAHADVRVLRHPPQGQVPRHVKPPGRHVRLGHVRPQGPQQPRRAVLRARIQHIDPVRLPHAVHPPCGELRLVFADGVHANFVFAHFISPQGRICGACRGYPRKKGAVIYDTAPPNDQQALC